MKATKTYHLLAFLFILSSVRCKSEKKNSLISNAVERVIFEDFAKSLSSIHVIHFGKITAEGEATMQKLMRHENTSMNFNIVKLKVSPAPKRKNFLLKDSVVFFESVKLFKSFCGNAYWQPDRNYRYKHMIHVPNLTQSDVITSVPEPFLIDNVAFLMNETSESIELVSSFMFTKQSCRTHQLMTINRFERSIGRWTDSVFYPKKYQNLFGCELKAAVGQLSTTYDQVFSALEKIHNASIRTVNYSRKSESDDSVDFLGFVDLIEDGSLTTSYLSFSTIVFFIPPGDEFKPFEKMFAPFQIEFWICIAATLAIAFVATQVISFSSKKVKNFCFGRNIQSPSFNLCAIFLNGAQYKMPKRNFSRFILILFVMWSLVIRTCYQSELFKFLQRDLRKPRVTSFEEMLEKNFTFPRNAHMLQALKYEFNKNEKPMNLTSIEICDGSPEAHYMCLDITAEPANKFTFLGDDRFLTGIHDRIYRNGRSSLTIMEGYSKTLSNGLSLKWFSPFNEILNDIVVNLQSSGLVERDIQNFMNPKGIKRKIDDIGPEVLTFEHLEIGFIFCLFPLFLSLIAFIGELCLPRVEKCKAKAVDYMTSLFVVVTFIKNQRF